MGHPPLRQVRPAQRETDEDYWARRRKAPSALGLAPFEVEPIPGETFEEYWARHPKAFMALVKKREFLGPWTIALIVAVFTLVFSAAVTRAEEIDRPITQGVVHAVILLPPPDLDGPLTQSVALEREDTGERVLCLSAANGTTVEADTDLIERSGAGILLRAYAYTGIDCAGEEPTPSVDVYRVTFGGPTVPVLVLDE